MDVPRINIAATIFAAQGTLLNDIAQGGYPFSVFKTSGVDLDIRNELFRSITNMSTEAIPNGCV